jgi:hypothetical protein
MAKHVILGSSIEGNKSSVAVRKISKNPSILDIEGVGLFFKYKSKIHAIVKVTEELSPKKHIICETSFLNLNDELEADIIELFTPKKLSLKLTSNFSSVHGIQSNNLSMFTYAKIASPFRFALNLIASPAPQSVIAS